MFGKKSLVVCMVLFLGVSGAFAAGSAPESAEEREKKRQFDLVCLKNLPPIFLRLVDIYERPDKLIMAYSLEPDYYDGSPAHYKDLRLEFRFGNILLEGDVGIPERPYAVFAVDYPKTPENLFGKAVYGYVNKISGTLVFHGDQPELMANACDIKGRITSYMFMHYYIIGRDNKLLPATGSLSAKNPKVREIRFGLRCYYENGDISHTFTIIAPPSAPSPYVRFRFVTSVGVVEAGEADKDPLRPDGWIAAMKRQEAPERYKLSNAFIRKFFPDDGESDCHALKIYEATAWRADGSKVDIMPWLVEYYCMPDRDLY